MKEVQLGEVASISRVNIKPEDIDSGTYYVGLEHINSEGLVQGKQVESLELSSNKFVFQSGDILYGKLRPYLRKISLAEKSGICSTDIIPIKVKDTTDVRYVCHLLRSNKLVDLANSMTSGANLPRISPKEIVKIPIPLPPLPVQQKIAAILDEADKLRQFNKQLITKYDELTQSLFLDMFGDPVTNPKGWEKKECGEFIDYLADIGSNGANKLVSEKLVMSDTEDYAIMIRTTNLSKNDFKNKLKYVSKEVYDFFKKSKVFGGEIIMNKIGSAGDFWLMPNLDRPVSLGLNQFIIRLKDMNTLYFHDFLSTDFGKQTIKSKLNGATTKSITKTAVRELPILVPPIALQNQFAERVQAIEAQKAQAQQSLEKAEELFGSLLQKAFKGELVK